MNYIVVDQLKAIIDDDTQKFFEAINTSNVKKFYLGMDFNKIDNEEFFKEEYSLNFTMSFGRNPLYTPQINDISMHLPSTPILYHWDYIPKVILKKFNNSLRYLNLLEKKYILQSRRKFAII